MEETMSRGSPTNSLPNPIWFSPETGVYTSKHHRRPLPQDPFQDIVSFLFSERHKGEIALLDSQSGLAISYADLRSMVESMAVGIHQLGLSSGRVVLILLPNSILFPIVLLAILSLGAVFSAMNPLSTREEIRKQMGSVQPAMAFTSLEKAAILDGARVPVLPVPENLNYDPVKYPIFHRMISCTPSLPRLPAIRQTDTAAILFTSGTSGHSKGVVLTHGNLIAMIELFVRFEASQYEKESWKDVYLAAIPMFHVYGLSLFVLGLLSLGTKVVVMRRFGVQEAIRAIERYEVTHFPLVPPIMAALVRAKDETRCELRSLKQVSCGAAPLSQKLIHDFLSRFQHVDFIQGYGMTESTAVGTRGFNNEEHKRYSSPGLLAPNMEAKIVDQETGQCFPPCKVGELWLRGPAIMKGYLNDEEETKLKIDKHGWLKTGDVGYFDQDGFLFIIDRLKDVIKYKGFQVAPADLEDVLTSHSDILDAAVTSDVDEEAGEIPMAFVVRKEASNLSPSEIMEFVAKKVAPYKKVRKVVFVQSIPRSPAGKILRRTLKSSHVASRL
ncbi:4-coumarate--CoA ligase-like 6 [Apostasia shenzhenica]|uniref:4-coumarate--CoA ligase n=1 Tax=Apostasia shenzhenica TaxID=1088818 RepID=A0A2I0ATH3_9ASPA|nr:4-coumarate--CoA ligase-like 6 [Apostasia shenzhenica]